MRNFYFWMLALLCSSLTFGQLSENFDSDITARGWSLYQTDDTDPGFVLTTDQFQSGGASYYHNDEYLNVESTSYMVSPSYTVQAGDEISVYVRQHGSVSNYNYSGIAISTASGDPIANPTDFTEIWEAGAGFSEDAWTQVTQALDTYVGQSIYIAFVYRGAYNHRYYVDNLYVGAACTAPEATATVVPACDSNQFNLDIEVTSLGTASSVTVSDDQGNSQTLTAPGNANLGPYASGTNVNYTVADASNGACNMTGSITHLCPPSNDDCSGATVIDTFPHNSSEDGTGATQTDFVSCGSETSNDGVWYTFTAASAEYTINMTSHDWDSTMQIFSGSCDALSCIATVDAAVTNATETHTFIAEAGVTYYINVARYSDSEDLPEGPFTLEILEEEIPCDAPTNLATTATTDLSTDVNWQGATGNATYDLAWGATGFTPSTEANASGLVSTSHTITGLTPETTYDVYVRGNCDPGTSEWVGPVTFTTFEPGYVLAGTDCAHPISVDTLPYATTDDTSYYGDDYEPSDRPDLDTNAVGDPSQYYLKGDDVVYAYTPGSDGAIDISVSDHGSWAGFFVFTGCPFESTVGGHTNSSSTTTLEVRALPVQAGVTYYIVISTNANPQSTPYTLNIAEASYDCPSLEVNFGATCDDGDENTVNDTINENCECEGIPIAANNTACDATNMVVGDVVTQSLIGATQTQEDTCSGAGSADVWFSFTTDGNLLYSIEETSNFDAVVSLFVGDDCGNLTQVGSCQDSPEKFIINEAGTYYFKVRPYYSSGNEGEISVSLTSSTPAENNTACDATNMVVGDVVAQSLVGASQTHDDSCYGSGTADVWFSFTTDGTQSYIIEETTTFDAVVSLFMGDDCGNLTQVGTCQDAPEKFEVSEAGTYYFKVRPYFSSGDEGDISVSLTSASFDCADLNANIGDACDDGNPDTVNDTINENCECQGSPAATNNTACTATDMVVGDVVAQSLVGASQTHDDTCYGSGTADVWFSFTADGTQSYIIEETTTFDAVVSLFMGDDCGNLTQVGTCQDTPEKFEVSEAGTYYFKVRPYYSSGNEGDISVSLTVSTFECPDLNANIGDACDDGNPDTINDTVNENCECEGVVPPENDDVCNAIPLTVGATSAGDAYTTDSATAETGETIGSCLSSYGNLESVWFSFEAPASGNVTVTTDIAGGTLNDTQLAIYEAPTDCADFTTLGTEVGCDQDGGGENGHNYRSIAIMTGLVAGNTYYIQIDGWGNATGTFGIEVHDTDNMGVADVATRDDVKLYPNPTSNELFISGIELKDAQVYNMSGKLVPVKTRDNMVDTKQLPTGTYIIRMIDLEGNVILRKFIKK